MPKFVGSVMENQGEVMMLPNNATEAAINGQRLHTGMPLVRVTFAQARMLEAQGHLIYASLDTTDTGGRKVKAKRWYRWFVQCAAVQTEHAYSRATPAMVVRTVAALTEWLALKKAPTTHPDAEWVAKHGRQ